MAAKATPLRPMAATDTTPAYTDPARTEKTGSARAAIVWAVVVVLVAAYAMEFGLQTLLWTESHEWASVNSSLSEVPQPLPASAALPPGNSKGTLLKSYDYEFRVPWTGKMTQTPPMATTAFHFDSGQIVTVFDPDAQLDVLRGIRTSKSQEYLNFAEVLAGQNVDSNCALFRTVYSASPAQVSPFMRQSDAERIAILLQWKLSFGVDAAPGIYSFDFGANHGLQFGSPASGHPAALRIFDDQGKQLRLIFAAAPGSSAQITQDDIDLAAQSLKAVPLLEQ